MYSKQTMLTSVSCAVALDFCDHFLINVKCQTNYRHSRTILQRTNCLHQTTIRNDCAAASM